MPAIDPKVFFANERTYLHWLNTAVTIGSIGSALLGFSGMAAASTTHGSFNAVRVVGLLMIALSIVVCAHSMYQFNRRGKLLRKRAGDGYEDAMAPVVLSLVLALALAAVYGTYITQGQVIQP